MIAKERNFSYAENEMDINTQAFWNCVTQQFMTYTFVVSHIREKGASQV